MRAENETRTRDPDLGKVVLYQLSYFRNNSEEKETRTPTGYAHYPLKVARLPFRHLSKIVLDYKFRAQNKTRTCTSFEHPHLKRARLPFRHLGMKNSF